MVLTSYIFLEPARPLVGRDFYNYLNEINRKINSLSVQEIINLYKQNEKRGISIRPISPSVLEVSYQEYVTALSKKFLTPGMFYKYATCERAFMIEMHLLYKNKALYETIDTIKNKLRGLLIHEYYMKQYAKGETEVYIESEKNQMLGYVDEIRRDGEKVQLIELKSSFNPNLIGASLQVMAYMLMLSDKFNTSVDNIEAYIVSPTKTYRVHFNNEFFEWHRKKLTALFENALTDDEEKFKKLLHPRLHDNNKCRLCSYRRVCYELPDYYYSRQAFDKSLGLGQQGNFSRNSSLDKYF